ncbi:retinoblastoma-related protein [Quercus suber]|uniref:Retinoblastoma-related protein n=1 Tax=Quercus suber TaxID=58331 RepID=A0AAW0J5V8_QUESU
MSPAALEKMEDAKPSASFYCLLSLALLSFYKRNNGMSLDENTYTQAMKLFKETKHLLQTNVSAFGNETNVDSEQQGSDDNGYMLCQILRAAKLNIVDFFKELPQFVVKAGPTLSIVYGADWENRLEYALTIAMVGYGGNRSYKRAIWEFFLTTEANVDKQSAVASASGYVSDYHHFGWLLFLALCIHAYNHFKDLVTCMNGLVSILIVLMCGSVKKDSKGVDILTSLCNKYETSEDELRKTMEKANNSFIYILNKKPQPPSECRIGNLENIDTGGNFDTHAVGLTYIENLLEDSSLSSSLGILEKDYDGAIRSKGELDERVFINDEDSILGSESLSGGSVNISGVKRKFDLIASLPKAITSPLSPQHSPASHANGSIGGSNSKMVAMPVSTAMTTAKWFRTVISPLPSKP